MTNSATNINIWVLADGTTGHNNQSLGVAEALGKPYIIKQIEYNQLAKLPTICKGASLIGCKTAITPPWPDIVISAGRKLAPIARYIKAQSGGQTKICHMMWPGGRVSDFDILAIPAHDRKKSNNIVITIGAPHQVTTESVNQAMSAWQHDKPLPQPPIITLLIGGGTKRAEFTVQKAKLLAQEVNNQSVCLNASVLVTVSRRTSPALMQYLKDSLNNVVEFYNPTHNEAENPYHAYLGLADAILVTGDSISMCTEACALGKPVFIYTPDGLVPEKHQRMHQSLYDAGYAKQFVDFAVWNMQDKSSISTPLNEAQKLAEIINCLI